MSDLLNKVKEHNPQLAHSLQRSLDGMDQLARATEQDVAVITEAQFVKQLLPVLARRGGDQDLSVWQDIAGHAMRPIEVVDNQSREVLFRVPPLLRPLKMEFTGRGRNSTYEILRTAEHKSKVVPSLGDEHIRSNLTSSVNREPADIDNIVAWNEILIRYGYEPLVNTPTSQEKEEVKEQVDLAEGFSGEYDEL